MPSWKLSFNHTATAAGAERRRLDDPEGYISRQIARPPCPRRCAHRVPSTSPITAGRPQAIEDAVGAAMKAATRTCPCSPRPCGDRMIRSRWRRVGSNRHTARGEGPHARATLQLERRSQRWSPFRPGMERSDRIWTTSSSGAADDQRRRHRTGCCRRRRPCGL